MYFAFIKVNLHFQQNIFQLLKSWEHFWWHSKAETAETWGALTLVWSRDEPQTAVVNGGILQGDPHPNNSAQGLRV